MVFLQILDVIDCKKHIISYTAKKRKKCNYVDFLSYIIFIFQVFK